jgi:hypothetical protein
MFSAQMPSAPWTAAGEGRDRRADGLGGGCPGAYRRGAPHFQRARASSPVSFAREASLNVRPIRAFCGRSRACSCGRARRSGRPASQRRPRGTDNVDRPCEIWRARARARSRALLARSSLIWKMLTWGRLSLAPTSSQVARGSIAPHLALLAISAPSPRALLQHISPHPRAMRRVQLTSSAHKGRGLPSYRTRCARLTQTRQRGSTSSARTRQASTRCSTFELN